MNSEILFSAFKQKKVLHSKLRAEIVRNTNTEAPKCTCPLMLSLQHYTLAMMNEQKHSFLIFHYLKKKINNLGTQAKQGSHLISLLPSCEKATVASPHITGGDS